MDGLKKIHGKDVEVHIPQPKLFDPSYLGIQGNTQWRQGSWTWFKDQSSKDGHVHQSQDLKTCVNPNPAISRPAAERIFRRAFWGASLGIKSRVHQSGRRLVSNTPARCWRTFYSRSLVPLGMPLVLKFGVREDNCHTQNIHHEQGSVDNTPCRAFNASHKSSIRTKVHTCPKRPQESQRLQDVLRCWLWSGPKFNLYIHQILHINITLVPIEQLLGHLKYIINK